MQDARSEKGARLSGLSTHRGYAVYGGLRGGLRAGAERDGGLHGADCAHRRAHRGDAGGGGRAARCEHPQDDRRESQGGGRAAKRAGAGKGELRAEKRQRGASRIRSAGGKPARTGDERTGEKKPPDSQRQPRNPNAAQRRARADHADEHDEGQRGHEAVCPADSGAGSEGDGGAGGRPGGAQTCRFGRLRAAGGGRRKTAGGCSRAAGGGRRIERGNHPEAADERGRGLRLGGGRLAGASAVRSGGGRNLRRDFDGYADAGDGWLRGGTRHSRQRPGGRGEHPDYRDDGQFV